MKTIFYTFLLGILTFARFSQAQEAEGYSSIDWDASTSTVIGYSETDLDDSAQAYYQAEVWAYIVDQNGTRLASMNEIDRGGVHNGVISVTFDIPGQYNMTYTINGTHSAAPYYSSGGCFFVRPNSPNALTSTSLTVQNSPNNCGGVLYDDFYFYGSFEDSDLGTYWGDLIGPGPENDTPGSVIDIMSTEDSASVTPSCGDDRDALMQEYADYKVAGLGLTCNSFTKGHSTLYFSATALLKCCPSRPTQEYEWILQGQQYLQMIDAWWIEAPVNFPVNSAYRDPAQNKLCLGAKDSRHQFGDAMDAGNVSHQVSDWQDLLKASLRAASDWQEPIDGPCGVACVHADMRKHAVLYVN